MNVEEKIGALLNKAQRTDNEHERLACQEAAERLMIKWGVDEAAARASQPSEHERVTSVSIPMTGPFARELVGVVNYVCDGLGTVRCVRLDPMHRGDDDPVCYAALFGFARDVERASSLATSIATQATEAAMNWVAQVDRDPWLRRVHTADKRWAGAGDFILAYGYRVGVRITALRQQEEVGADRRALVLRSDAIDGAIREQVGELGGDEKRTLRGAALDAGIRAGDAADIGLGRIEGQ